MPTGAYVIKWISSIKNWFCIQQRGKGQRERDEIMRRVWGKANVSHGGRLVGVIVALLISKLVSNDCSFTTHCRVIGYSAEKRRR